MSKVIGVFADAEQVSDFDLYFKMVNELAATMFEHNFTLAFDSKFYNSKVHVEPMNAIGCTSLAFKKLDGDATILLYTTPEDRFEEDERMTGYKIVKIITSSNPQQEMIDNIDAAVFLLGSENLIDKIQKPIYVSNILQRYPLSCKAIDGLLHKKSGLNAQEWNWLTDPWISPRQFAALVHKGINLNLQ